MVNPARVNMGVETKPELRASAFRANKAKVNLHYASGGTDHTAAVSMGNPLCRLG